MYFAVIAVMRLIQFPALQPPVATLCEPVAASCFPSGIRAETGKRYGVSEEETSNLLLSGYLLSDLTWEKMPYLMVGKKNQLN